MPFADRLIKEKVSMFYEAVNLENPTKLKATNSEYISEIPYGLLEIGRYTKDEILEKIESSQVKLENLRLRLNRHD